MKQSPEQITEALIETAVNTATLFCSRPFTPRLIHCFEDSREDQFQLYFSSPKANASTPHDAPEHIKISLNVTIPTTTFGKSIYHLCESINERENQQATPEEMHTLLTLLHANLPEVKEYLVIVKNNPFLQSPTERRPLLHDKLCAIEINFNRKIFSEEGNDNAHVSPFSSLIIMETGHKEPPREIGTLSIRINPYPTKLFALPLVTLTITETEPSFKPQMRTVKEIFEMEFPKRNQRREEEIKAVFFKKGDFYHQPLLKNLTMQEKEILLENLL